MLHDLAALRDHLSEIELFVRVFCEKYPKACSSFGESAKLRWSADHPLLENAIEDLRGGMHVAAITEQLIEEARRQIDLAIGMSDGQTIQDELQHLDEEIDQLRRSLATWRAIQRSAESETRHARKVISRAGSILPLFLRTRLEAKERGQEEIRVQWMADTLKLEECSFRRKQLQDSLNERRKHPTPAEAGERAFAIGRGLEFLAERLTLWLGEEEELQEPSANRPDPRLPSTRYSPSEPSIGFSLRVPRYRK